MRTRLRRTVPILIAGLVGVMIGGWAIDMVSARDDVYSFLDLFNDALAKVEGAYVEDVETKDLIYGAVRGMLATLDPYSVFLDEDAFKGFQVTTEGEFGGLGIQITARDGVLTVVSPIEGTPAYDLGIQSGDRIVRIEGQLTRGITVDEAVKKLRGEPGTKVKITIHREGAEELLDYTVTRDIIRIDSVPYSFMLEDGVGYVRVSRFSRTTAEELTTALDNLETQGMTALLLDLRRNPGGLLSQAVDVSDIFLDKGELIVRTSGRMRSQNQEFYATTPARFGSDFPIVILVDGGSASASEILAGSLQDWDRAVVVGTTTFGKGSVQTLMKLRPLTKGTAMKLTTAKYFISSGRCIEREDLLEEDAVAESEDVAESEPSRPEFQTAGGRLVYGGGGISPDMRIEAERRADLVIDLERREEFFEFAIDYTTDTNVTDPDFEVSDAMWESFLDFLVVDGFEFEEDEIEEHRPAIETSIKRDLTRKLWGREAAYVATSYADGQLAEAAQFTGRADRLSALLDIAASSTPDADE